MNCLVHNTGRGGWMASLIQWTWTWANSGRWWGTGGLACCNPCGSRESDMTWQLNNSNNKALKRKVEKITETFTFQNNSDFPSCTKETIGLEFHWTDNSICNNLSWDSMCLFKDSRIFPNLREPEIEYDRLYPVLLCTSIQSCPIMFRTALQLEKVAQRLAFIIRCCSPWIGGSCRVYTLHCSYRAPTSLILLEMWLQISYKTSWQTFSSHGRPFPKFMQMSAMITNILFKS